MCSVSYLQTQPEMAWPEDVTYSEEAQVKLTHLERLSAVWLLGDDFECLLYVGHYMRDTRVILLKKSDC